MATVTAPAGYGKSTQVAAWAAQDGRALAWVDVEPADNDANTLIEAILAGLTHLAGSPPGEATDAPPSGDAALLLSHLARAVRTCAVSFILVLDDVHLIDARGSIDVVDVLARNLPARSTLVLIARSEPSPALTRVRVHQGSVAVTTTELALNARQAAEVLDGMGVTLDAEALDQLVQDTEGWPVGVRLAGLAHLAEPDGAAPPAEGFVRYDRDAANYVREEWLRGMSADDVWLLTRVAVLDWLTGPLCDHVLERSGTATALHRLHETRLIVIPLDRRHRSYRMHRLLREVLAVDLDRTDPGAATRCHSRASDWFESRGDVDRALHHALGAGDLARAEALVEAHTVAFQLSGRYTTVARWIDAFPGGHLASRPSLCLLAAVAALGDPERDGASVTAWLRTGEGLLARAPDPDPTLGLRFEAFRALVGTGSVGDAIDGARRARDGLPPGIWHSIACLAHGAQSFAVGDDQIATEMLEEAAAEAEVHGALTTIAISRAHLATLQSAGGDWSQAAPLVRSARALMDAHRLDQYPTMLLVTAMAALVEAVEGDPQRARAEWLLTRRSLTYMRGVAPWANVQSRIALARTSLLLSDRAAARTLMEEAESLVIRQPEAIRPKAQLAELEELLAATASKALWAAYSLTTAELRVLHYLPTNLTLSDIADRLFVSRNTAKSHAASIYRKLGARRRGDAVEIAEAVGLLEPTEGSARS